MAREKSPGKLVKLMQYEGTFLYDGDKWSVRHDTLLKCRTTGYIYTTTGSHLCTVDNGLICTWHALSTESKCVAKK